MEVHLAEEEAEQAAPAAAAEGEAEQMAPAAAAEDEADQLAPAAAAAGDAAEAAAAAAAAAGAAVAAAGGSCSTGLEGHLPSGTVCWLLNINAREPREVAARSDNLVVMRSWEEVPNACPRLPPLA